MQCFVLGSLQVKLFLHADDLSFETVDVLLSELGNITTVKLMHLCALLLQVVALLLHQNMAFLFTLVSLVFELNPMTVILAFEYTVLFILLGQDIIVSDVKVPDLHLQLGHVLTVCCIVCLLTQLLFHLLHLGLSSAQLILDVIGIVLLQKFVFIFAFQIVLLEL